MSKHMMPAINVAALKSSCPTGVLAASAEAPTDPEKLLAEVNKKLGELNGDVKKTAENALKEAKQAGDVSAETKATADKLLTGQTELQNAVKKLTEDLEGANNKNLELAQEIANGLKRGADGPVSMGAQVEAEAERAQAYRENGATGSLRFEVNNTVTTAAGSGGGLIPTEEEGTPVNQARRRLVIVGMLPRGTVSSDSITYARQTLRNDGAAPVPEEGAAPASDYGWTKTTVNVKKIAHHTNISEETLSDAPLLRSEVDGEMRYGLGRELDEQVLLGDGTGENLDGLVPNATPFAASPSLPNATRIDRLRLAILQITLADYMATHFVLSPTDWTAIDLLKDSEQRYIFGMPGAQSTPVLWGKGVAESNSMTAGEWLAGDMDMAATFYSRKEAEVLISSEHGTNFVEGMLTMKGSLRAALAVKRPTALVTGDFTFA